MIYSWLSHLFATLLQFLSTIFPRIEHIFRSFDFINWSLCVYKIRNSMLRGGKGLSSWYAYIDERTSSFLQHTLAAGMHQWDRLMKNHHHIMTEIGIILVPMNRIKPSIKRTLQTSTVNAARLSKLTWKWLGIYFTYSPHACMLQLSSAVDSERLGKFNIHCWEDRLHLKSTYKNPYNWTNECASDFRASNVFFISQQNSYSLPILPMNRRW